MLISSQTQAATCSAQQLDAIALITPYTLYYYTDFDVPFVGNYTVAYGLSPIGACVVDATWVRVSRALDSQPVMRASGRDGVGVCAHDAHRATGPVLWHHICQDARASTACVLAVQRY